MNISTLVIFDRESGILEVLTEMARECSPKTRILATTDANQALKWILEHQPKLIITEAIPVLDVQAPKEFQANDPGFQLIKAVREHPRAEVKSTWIMVTMSRCKEDIPLQVLKLLGERACLLEKPFNLSDVRLVIMSQIR
jgi:DNA-binding NarL/FixJ family response regulator